MLRHFAVWAPLIAFALSLPALADQITLKNGDRLTGTIVKSDGKTLVLHTEAAGDVEFKYDAIQEIKTEEEFHVVSKGGKTAVGPVTTRDGKLEVATKTAGTVDVPKDEVTLLAEEQGYEKSLHPGALHGWNGGINVGFSLARGNSQSENFALAFNGVHTAEHDKLTLYASSIDTKNELATPSTVANLNQGGFLYDRDLAPRVFVFGAADFMANALQFLDLRQVYSGGFGYHVIKSETTVLDFFAGLNYTHETYSNGTLLIPATPTTPPIFASYGKTNRFAAITLGEELNHKFGKTTVLTQSAGFFPNLQNTGEYRFTFNLGTVTKISKWLGWQNQFSDIDVSNPPTGAKKNDVIFTTGLNIAFTH